MDSLKLASKYSFVIRRRFQFNFQPYAYPYSGYGNMMDIDFTSDEIHVSSSPGLETKFEDKLQSDTEYKVTNAIAGYKRTSEDLTVERYQIFTMLIYNCFLNDSNILILKI